MKESPVKAARRRPQHEITKGQSIRFPKDLHKELRYMAADLESSITAIVLEGCRRMLAEHKKGGGK